MVSDAHCVERLTRLSACACLVLVASAAAGGGESQVSHGVSDFGALKYPRVFAHFDYVNPNAPKGGSLVLATSLRFNSFNPITNKGIRAPGNHVIEQLAGPEVAMLYDPLFWPSDDETGSFYGNLVETVELAEDFTWVIFRLRPEARWHDGVPVSARDVKFTFDSIAEGAGVGVKQAFNFIDRSEILGEREVRFHFREDRDLSPNNVMIMSKWPIVPEHHWRGRDMSKTTLEPPLGSGPYRIADFEPGRFILYERVPDYWGRDLGIHRGRHNFDSIRYEVYGDAIVTREALRKGMVDYYMESDTRHWATSYDIPARDKGWLVLRKHNFLQYVGFWSGLAFNTRRPNLADRRVREALTLAFDYEWANRTLNHGVYERPVSYFPGSYLQASGTPTDTERLLLAPFRAQLPARIFNEPFHLPRSTGYGYHREALIRARDLLEQAGWRVQGGVLADDDGRPFTLRFVIRTFEQRRTLLPYVSVLQRLGIESKIHLVETAQYVNILNDNDYDGAFNHFRSAITPTFGLRARTHSASAASKLANPSGIAHPAVDAMLAKMLSARSRRELTDAVHALDRVLLWNFYFIPLVPMSDPLVVYWDKFGRPDSDPKYRTSFPDAWWWDEEKAQRVLEGLAIGRQ